MAVASKVIGFLDRWRPCKSGVLHPSLWWLLDTQNFAEGTRNEGYNDRSDMVEDSMCLWHDSIEWACLWLLGGCTVWQYSQLSQ